MIWAEEESKFWLYFHEPVIDVAVKGLDPEIVVAVKDLIKSAFAPNEPEIDVAVKGLDPEIVVAVKDLIKSAFAPNEPEMSSLICADDESKFWLYFHEPVIDVAVKGLEPEIVVAVRVLIKSAFAPNEPEIESAVNGLDPDIPSAVRDLIKSAFVPNEPEIESAVNGLDPEIIAADNVLKYCDCQEPDISSLICAEEESRFWLYFHEPVIDVAVKGLEPEIVVAVRDLIKSAFAPNEPEISSLICADEESTPSPWYEPDIPAAVKDLIKSAFTPNEPEISFLIWAEEESKFWLYFHEPVIEVAVNGLEPDIPVAVKDLIKSAFVPKEPEISSLICVDEESNPGTWFWNDPEMAAAVKVLKYCDCHEPDISSLIWAEEESKFWLYFHDPVIEVAVKGLDPEIVVAVRDLIKSAFAPNEPEIDVAVKGLDPDIPSAVKDLIRSAFAPNEPEMSSLICAEEESTPSPWYDPEIPAAVSVLIRSAFAPNEPEISSLICADDESKFWLYFHEPVIVVADNVLKYCDCHEPDIIFADKVLKYCDCHEPEISSAIWVDEESTPSPWYDPEIPAAVKDLIRSAFIPNEPEISSSICAEEESKFWLYFHEPEIVSDTCCK